jgi:hypothetical protein
MLLDLEATHLVGSLHLLALQALSPTKRTSVVTTTHVILVSIDSYCVLPPQPGQPILHFPQQLTSTSITFL